jgi:transcriptional regulator with XRE-family HTH domain
VLSSEQSRGIDLDGRRVRQQRRARAWTQALLAEAAQVSIDTIGRAEKGQAISLENAMAIAGALDRDIAFFRSGQSFAASNIPIRVPEHFLGREDALGSIANALKRYERRVAITALHGMRGVGKTTLAAVYADRHRGDYRATWWIRAQTETTMRADLVTLGIRMGWVGADDKEDEALAAVMERLCHEGEGVLLIYDNAIEARAIAPYLPVGGAAKVLVTSTAHAWRGVAEPIEIGLWPKTTGADYLIARTGRAAEREAGKILSEALGGLPLAHEQVAGYCERLHVSLADYAKRFAAAPARLLDEERHAPTAYHDGRTVAKTFTLAIEEAAKAHPREFACPADMRSSWALHL